jgi:ABC-type bacteriocin/lantibiotic exporter with double-glycine peptidase domain
VTWRAAAALALLGAAGCASMGGRSRTFDEARLSTDGGWIMAAPAPLVRQEGSQDCGAASLAMIAGHWRRALTLDEAAAALTAAAAPARPTQGARLGDLRDVARARGLTAFAIVGDRATIVHELEARRPVIVGLHIRKGPRRALSHYEVVVAMNARDDRFVTIDPASGWRVRSWADFDAAWLPAGRPALVVVGVNAPAP